MRTRAKSHRRKSVGSGGLDVFGVVRKALADATPRAMKRWPIAMQSATPGFEEKYHPADVEDKGDEQGEVLCRHQFLIGYGLGDGAASEKQDKEIEHNDPPAFEKHPEGHKNLRLKEKVEEIENVVDGVVLFLVFFIGREVPRAEKPSPKRVRFGKFTLCILPDRPRVGDFRQRRIARPFVEMIGFLLGVVSKFFPKPLLVNRFIAVGALLCVYSLLSGFLLTRFLLSGVYFWLWWCRGCPVVVRSSAIRALLFSDGIKLLTIGALRLLWHVR